jgi:hypothetical protein
VLESKTVQALKEQEAKLQADYADNLRIYKPGYPKMLQLQSQMDELDRNIKGEIDAVKRSVETSYESLKAQQKTILAKLEQTKKDVLDLQGRSIRYNILKRDVDTDRAIYNSLLTRLNEVGVTGGTGTNNITVVDRAEIPPAPFKPDLRQNLIIAMLLGLIGGVALAFFLEHLDDTIRMPEDMEQLTQLPVLGVVPKLDASEVGEGRSLGLLAHDDVRSTFRRSVSVRAHRAAVLDPRRCASRVHGDEHGARRRQDDDRAGARDQQRADRASRAADRRRHAASRRAQGARHRQFAGLSNYLSSDVPPLGVVRTTQIPNFS